MISVGSISDVTNCVSLQYPLLMSLSHPQIICLVTLIRETSQHYKYLPGRLNSSLLSTFYIMKLNTFLKYTTVFTTILVSIVLLNCYWINTSYLIPHTVLIIWFDFYSKHFVHNKAINVGPLGTDSIHQTYRKKYINNTKLVLQYSLNFFLNNTINLQIFIFSIFDKYTPGQIFYHILRLDIILVRKNIFLKYSVKSDKSSGRN